MTFISPQFARFLVTGFGATVVHIAVAVFLTALLEFKPVAANGIAFLIATGFSYLCNTQWSFQAKINLQSASRYILTTLISFAVTLSLSAWAQHMNLHYGAGIILTILALPIINYFAHYYFTYAE